ncbi:hypothetical protein CASFOL_006678 [Castilleja foliolosa]|uniref:Secreted protein n=1 Tax=Castilleja foliolosa TaxID=1961234 RepID=A0ABD3EAY7_9LAMI
MKIKNILVLAIVLQSILISALSSTCDDKLVIDQPPKRSGAVQPSVLTSALLHLYHRLVAAVSKKKTTTYYRRVLIKAKGNRSGETPGRRPTPLIDTPSVS